MTEVLNASVGRSNRPALSALLRLWLPASLALAALPAVAPAQYPAPQVAAALRSAGGDREVRGFYKARSYRPLWIRGSTLGPEAERVLDLVERADLDGLDPEEYRPDALAEAIDRARSGSPRDLARAEMLLSRTFARYVRDVRRPRATNMVYVDRELAPVTPPVRSVLEAASSAPSLGHYLESAGWMNPIYGQLRKALAASAGGTRGSAPSVPPGPTLRTGATGERVRMLRLRLGLDPDGSFDDTVAEAVREAQAARGLPQDGIAGPRTLAALNETNPQREQILRLNLERARALPANPGRRYVLVDAASARLWMYEDGRVRDSMRVIVGKPTEQTPVMAGLIRFAQVNPYWNIPPDLVRLRIVPIALSKGPAALKAKYEVLTDWSANARPVDPSTVDWAAVAAGRQEVRVRQLPGGDNAMGKMKFMFPNELGIYLHDNPEKHLFRKEERRFSSGCVRVEDAARLAKWLFGKPLVARSAAPEQQVNLPAPVPVYITYLTAMPEGQNVVFRSDVYNRDRAQLARAGSGAFAGR